MADNDPLLTTLCGVCRAVPPRYRCPRCAIRYCSVNCSRRHRARAGCSGIRDVTAFVPRARLCTPAGIDHDYNFLRSIELARTRNERLLVDELNLLQPADLRPSVAGEEEPDRAGGGRGGGRGGRGGRGRGGRGGMAERGVLQKQWQGDQLRFVPTGDAAPRPPPPSGSSKKVRMLCRRDDVVLLHAPVGLARQRENCTTVATLRANPNDKTSRGDVHLHWQVEWLVYEDGLAAAPTRILRPLLDYVPLNKGYAATMAWVLQRATKAEADEADSSETPKKRRANAPKTASPPGKKRRLEGDGEGDGNGDDQLPEGDDAKDDRNDNNSVRFFLLRARLPGQPGMAKPPGKELIPLQPDDTLTAALPGRAVLEFPTIYVLPGASETDLPPRCVLGSTERRVVKSQTGTTAKVTVEESETSSSGSSKEDSESDNNEDVDVPVKKESDEDDEAGIKEEGEEDEIQIKLEVEKDSADESLPLLKGLGGGGSKLVVYDSWSEGEDEEKDKK